MMTKDAAADAAAIKAVMFATRAAGCTCNMEVVADLGKREVWVSHDDTCPLAHDHDQLVGYRP